MASSFVLTFTGERVDLLSPDPKTINILDIAHSLSRQCRFNAHTSQHYSVAQHSVLVSKLCDTQKLWGLLHDAHEAYLGDIVSPVKQLLGPAFEILESRMQHAVCERFGLTPEVPPEVESADLRVLALEAKELFEVEPEDWGLKCEVPARRIYPQNCGVARNRFLGVYKELGGVI